MYINDVSILYYACAGGLGLLIGSFINWCNYRLPENKKVFSKDILKKEERKKVKTNYLLMVINAILYIVLLYFCKIHDTLYANLSLIKFGLLIPMLL